MLEKCPKKIQMSEQNWSCLDKMSEVNFSPAETLSSIYIEWQGCGKVFRKFAIMLL